MRKDVEPSAPARLYEEPCWYACCTRPRHEKMAGRLLASRGIGTFLPIVERTSKWKDRRKQISWPLLSGYVFGRFDLRSLGRVLSTPRVITVVRANGYPTPIADGEIENIRRFAEALQGSGVAARQVPFFQEGQRLRVMDGPFRDVECVVIERRGKRRVLIGIRHLGRGLEVDIGVHLLAPVESDWLAAPTHAVGISGVPDDGTRTLLA